MIVTDEIFFVDDFIGLTYHLVLTKFQIIQLNEISPTRSKKKSLIILIYLFACKIVYCFFFWSSVEQFS